MFRTASVLALLLSTSIALADVGPPAPSTNDPVAKLSGPTSARTGQQLKFTTEGSSGQDIKFTISPPASSFEPVKLMDGKDTPGVIFTPSDSGTYYIHVILNGNSKTAFHVFALTVTESTNPNVPPSDPSKPYFQLKQALEADGKTDAMISQHIAQLEALFQQWPTMAKSSTTWDQFNATFKDAAKTVLENNMPNSRKAIGEYLQTRIPNTPFDRTVVETIANEILQTIKLSK